MAASPAGSIAGIEAPEHPFSSRWPLRTFRAGLRQDVGRHNNYTHHRGRDWILAVEPNADTLHVYRRALGSDETLTEVAAVDVGRDPGRTEDAWGIAVTSDGKVFVSMRGFTRSPGDAIAIFDLDDLTVEVGPHRPPAHVAGFGAGSGLGAMALSPDGVYLAVAGRRRSTCPDRVRDYVTTRTVNVQVGCDDIWVLRTADLDPFGGEVTPSPVSIGARTTLPTRPIAYPYAVAWLPNSSRLAYASLTATALDPWPRFAGQELNLAGGLAMGDVAAGTWTYNLALRGSVAGETVSFSPDGGRVLVGTIAGVLYSFPTSDAVWVDSEADPESALHATGPLFGKLVRRLFPHRELHRWGLPRRLRRRHAARRRLRGGSRQLGAVCHALLIGLATGAPVR